jgi:hypothetical protein
MCTNSDTKITSTAHQHLIIKQKSNALFILLLEQRRLGVLLCYGRNPARVVSTTAKTSLCATFVETTCDVTDIRCVVHRSSSKRCPQLTVLDDDWLFTTLVGRAVHAVDCEREEREKDKL